MDPEITGIGLPQNLEIQPRHYDIGVDEIDNSFGYVKMLSKMWMNQ